MRRFWSRILVFVVVVMVALAVVAVWYFRIHGFRSVLAYREMDKECHRIWKDLALRKVYAGEDLDEFLASNTPSTIRRHDNYGTMRFYQNYNPGSGGLYFTGITVIAGDNRLVWAVAASCTWQHTFFNELSQEDAYYESYRTYVESLPPRPGQQ